jgi:hypothetical protein
MACGGWHLSYSTTISVSFSISSSILIVAYSSGLSSLLLPAFSATSV